MIRSLTFLALLSAFMAAPIGCAHTTPSEKAFGNAYAACMTAKGLAVAPSVGQTAWNDLNGGANSAAIVAQLEALAKQAGQDAVTCAVQAWMTPTPGAPAAKNPAGVEAANIYLKNHSSTTARSNSHAALSPPRGCGPRFGALGA